VEFFREDHTGYDVTVISVSELTGNIRVLLEESFPGVWVEGEISNFKLHSSGHTYFSLKDADSSIACVLWKGRRTNLLFQMRDGLHVKIFGRLTVYEKYGKYQLDVFQVIPVGEGGLQQAFFELKQKLFEEGLFDESVKKELPPFPKTVGIVTSPTGAAVHDIITVISRRFPCVKIILRPVRVQGVGSAEEIAQAIDELNEFGNIDVIIAGRGGGSLEDLWAFNEEVVARAVYRSQVPVVSSVGHEVDFTICDFAADVRAPTPSAAAEMVVPDRKELLLRIFADGDAISNIVSHNIEDNKNRISYIASGFAFRNIENRFRQSAQYIDLLRDKLTSSCLRSLEKHRTAAAGLEMNLAALNPDAVLQRGYSITTLLKSSKVVTSADQIKAGDKIKTRFYRGSSVSTVDFSVIEEKNNEKTG